jgi:hypothetical protein
MKRVLHTKKGVFVLLLALFMGMGTTYAFNFAVRCSTGQWLYYNVIDATNHYVELTYPGTLSNPWEGTMISGTPAFPSTVTYNNITYTVKAIGDYAFYQCDDLTGTLIIPNTVTSIGDYAFSGCGYTGSLTIPNSVITIGNYAFYDLYKVSGTLTLSNSLTSIGDYAFGSCFNPGPSHTSFTGSLTIPNSVVSIGNHAFDHSFINGPGTLTISNSVASMGSGVFANCIGFTQVNYNATNCTDFASNGLPFEGCSGTLTIDSNVQKVPAHLTKGASFTHVNYNAINCPDVTMAAKPFEGCIGTLTIGSNVTRIPAYMFYDCDGFTGSVTIPNSVTTIGNRAFGWSGGFSGYLTIGTGVTSIGNQAFYASSFTQVFYYAINCADVTNNDDIFGGMSGQLTIGNNVQRIPAYMFHNAIFTGSLNIPNSVTEIGLAAFWNCTGFNGTLTIGNSVTTIGGWAFCLCSGFTGSLTIPNSVAIIGECAFSSCIGFTGSLSIGNSVTTIGDQAFENGNFSSVTLGNSVSSIGNFAFYNCNDFSSMTVCPETPPTMITTAFNGVSKSIPVYVPCNSVDAYQAASGWSEFTDYQCKPLVTVTAFPTEGGSVSGGGSYSSGTSVTVTATPNTDYLFMNWSNNGTVVSCNPSYTFTVTEDVALEAVFMAQTYLGTIIGEVSSSSVYLPSHSYFKFSLSQQIYTATELEGITTINSISFFNTGDEEIRNYDIYLKHTPKASFGSTTDWIIVTDSDMVFSDSVTMRTGLWTTLVLDTPFEYDGTSNLVLVVDDNSNAFTTLPHMSCRTYATENPQALRISSDNNNYFPSFASYYNGSLRNEKNQIMLNRWGGFTITATSTNASMGIVSGGGQYGYGDCCTLKATPTLGHAFLSWTDDNGSVVSTDANYSFIVMADKNLTANFMDDGDFCTLTFDLYDSYGDGWNGNKLMVDLGNGTSQQLTLQYDQSHGSFTLPVEDESHVQLSWNAGSYMYECSFTVSYANGELMYMGNNLNGNYLYEFDMDCAGQTSTLTYLGDHSRGNNYYLPSFSYYKYSLSEQIYTADEIGTSGIISSVSFYNEGTEAKTRNYTIYMAVTEKTAFESQTDWISTSNAVQVFSGNVTMSPGKWTTIPFSNNSWFDYDGVSNLVLIVDDNTGSFTQSPHMSCRVYTADGFQALRIYNDNTNFDPASPSSYNGTLMGVKNQIMLNITPCFDVTDLNVHDITISSANIEWNSDSYNIELKYREVEPGVYHSWTTVSNVASPYALIGLLGETTYEIQVRSNCGGGIYSDEVYATFTTMPCETIVVDAVHPFTEDFAGTAFAPACWENIASGTHSWSRSTYHNHTEGSSGSAYSGYYGDTYLVLPYIQLSSNATSAQLTFWSYYNYLSDYGNSSVVLLDGEVETELWTLDTTNLLNGNWYETNIDLSAYKGQTITLAFKYEGNNAHIWYIDDVEIAVFNNWTIVLDAYTANGGYHLLSFPVVDIAPESVTHMLENTYDLYAYDEAAQEQEWRNYKANTFSLEAGKGYLYANSVDVVLSFTGSPYNGNGTFTLQKTGNAATAGWNLVGNPYNQRTYLNRSFYVMNDEGSGVVVADRNYVEPMEGVFVIAATNGETLTFSTTAPAKNPQLVLNLNQGENIVDRAVIRFEESRMLPKFQINEGGPKLFIHEEGVNYAVINHYRDTDRHVSTEVCFKTDEDGTYTLSLGTESVEFSYLHLIDSVTGADIDLLQQPSYTFEVRGQVRERHFTLNYK